jgi:hypothetical protein
MKVLMKRSTYGTEYESDGTSAGQKLYKVGGEYEVSEKLGQAFIDMGAAESKGSKPTKKEEPVIEEKKLDGAPENKGLRKKKKVRSK